MKSRLVATLAAFAITASTLVVPPSTAAAATLPTVTNLSDTVTTSGRLFQWDNVPGASAYRIQVADDSSFSTQSILAQQDTYVTQWVPQTVLGSDSDRTLFWRVAPFGNAIQQTTLGEYSEVSLFDEPALDSPALVAPIGGATVNYPTAVTFEWEEVPGAVSYVLEYSTQQDFPAPNNSVSWRQVTTANSYTALDALTASTFYWRVTAQYQKPKGTSSSQPTTTVASPTSNVEQFHVAWPADASRPTLLAPLDATGNQSVVQDLKFEWTPVEGAKEYVFELSKTRDPFTPEETATVTGTVYVPKKQLSNEGYFWRVRAVNTSGSSAVNGIEGAYSDVWQFSKKTTDSSAPVLSTEEAETVGLAPTPTFGSASAATPSEIPYNEFALSWEPFPRASFYKVSILPYLLTGDEITCYTANTSATIVTGVGELPNHANRYSPFGTCLWPSKASDRLQVGETYQWQVEAVDLPAGSTRDITSTSYPTNVVRSDQSEPRYFTLTESTYVFGETAPVIDQAALTQRVTLNPGEPFPLIAWNPVHPVLETEDSLFGYEIEVYTGQRSNTILRAYTTQSHIQLIGVINDTTTQEEYEVVVQPVVPKTTQLAPDQVLYYTAIGKSAPASWSKSTSKITGLDATEQIDGTVLLSWTPHFDSGPNDGGNRGYYIVVEKANGSAVGAAKTEYPFLVAQNPVNSETAALRPLAAGNYRYRVAALDANGNVASGSYSEYKEFSISLPAPTATRELAVTGNSASLAWNPTTASDSYRVLLKQPGSSSFSRVINTNQTSVTITDLVPGNYEWKVVSLQGSGSSAILSEESAVRAFRIEADQASLTTTNSVEFTVDNRALQWEPVDKATRYIVDIAQNSSFTASVQSYETVNLSFLPPNNYVAGTTYYWRVRAVADKVSSNTSNRTALSTSEVRQFTVKTVPGVVTLDTPKLDGSQFAVTWKPLEGAARGSASESPIYVIQYRVQSTLDDWSDAITIETSADATSYTTPSGLAPNTSYQFRIAARNSQGMGVWSTIRVAKTAGPPTASPGKITATPSGNGAVISWQAVRGTATNPVTSYQVRYRVKGTSAWQVKGVGGSALKVTLNGLRKNTNYQVEVAALNAYGVGAFGSTSFYLDAQPTPTTGYVQVTPTPDVTGDGYGDLLAVDGNGSLWLFTGSATGAIGSGKKLTGNWADLTVSAPGDFNSDGKADILAKNSKGELFFYAGNGKGTFANGIRVGHGWGPYDIIPAGDVTGDGTPDVLAIKQSTGELFYYAGNGRGGFTGKLTKNGQGWTNINLYPAGDLNGDGNSDILSIRRDGTLHTHYGRGDGGFRKSFQSGQGWGAYSLFAGSDGNNDGRADLYGRAPNGDLYYYAGKEGGFRASVKIASGW